MIKKMLLEDARNFGKPIVLMDVDFSKAYDSTEKFANDLSLNAWVSQQRTGDVEIT